MILDLDTPDKIAVCLPLSQEDMGIRNHPAEGARCRKKNSELMLRCVLVWSDILRIHSVMVTDESVHARRLRPAHQQAGTDMGSFSGFGWFWQFFSLFVLFFFFSSCFRSRFRRHVTLEKKHVKLRIYTQVILMETSVLKMVLSILVYVSFEGSLSSFIRQ